MSLTISKLMRMLEAELVNYGDMPVYICYSTSDNYVMRRSRDGLGNNVLHLIGKKNEETSVTDSTDNPTT